MDKTTIGLLLIVFLVIISDKFLSKNIDKSIVNNYKDNVRKVVVITVLNIIATPIIIFTAEYLIYWDTSIGDYFNLKLNYSKSWIVVYSLVGFILSILLFRRFYVKFIIEDIFYKPKRLFTWALLVFITKILIHYSLFPKIADKFGVYNLGITRGDYYPFRYYVTQVLKEEVELFVPALAVVSIIFWLLPDNFNKSQ